MCKFWLQCQTNKKRKIRDNLIVQINKKLPIFEENAKKAQFASPNPHNKKYHRKLVELISLQDTAQDNFINWITGIASGSIFWGLSKILDPSLKDLTVYCKITFFVGMDFLVLLTAICFKLFFRNKFNYLKLETEILGVLWKSHELKLQIENDLKQSGNVALDIEIEFLKNHLHNIDLATPEYVSKIKKKILLKSKILDFLYKLTVLSFLVTIIVGLLMILLKK